VLSKLTLWDMTDAQERKSTVELITLR